MATKAVVDALYEKTATLLVGRREEPITVPRQWLPAGVQEGDVLSVAEGAPVLRRVALAHGAGSAQPRRSVPLRVEIDPDETRRRRARIRKMNAELMGREEPQ